MFHVFVQCKTQVGIESSYVLGSGHGAENGLAVEEGHSRGSVMEVERQEGDFLGERHSGQTEQQVQRS